MPRPLAILPPLIFVALAVMFYVGMGRNDPDSLHSAIVGETTPSIRVSQLSDIKPFTDADLRSDGVKLVNFWASWCAPCRVEHPALTRLSDEGIPIYGINYKDTERDAMAFLEELGNPYAGMGADAQGRTALDWGVYGVPETYVINGEGIVVLRLAGPITERTLTERIRPAIRDATSN